MIGGNWKKHNERMRLIFDVLPVSWALSSSVAVVLLVKSSDTHWILCEVRLNLLPAAAK